MGGHRALSPTYWKGRKIHSQARTSIIASSSHQVESFWSCRRSTVVFSSLDTHKDGSGVGRSKSATWAALGSPLALPRCTASVGVVELSLQDADTLTRTGSFPEEFIWLFLGCVFSGTCHILFFFLKSTDDSSYQLIGFSSSCRTEASPKGLMGKQTLNRLYSQVNSPLTFFLGGGMLFKMMRGGD